MQTSEGMYTADVTSGQLRAVEEKLMDRIEKLEIFIEVLINAIPGACREDIIRNAAMVFLEQKKNRRAAEEAAIWERRADEPSAVERHPKDVRGYP